MTELIEQKENGCIVSFELHVKHSINEIWDWLTDNEKLKQWFPELCIDNLCEGGNILFDMQDGTFIKMRILACINFSVLEFIWGDGVVRFELYSEPEGCTLIFKETITKITNHTPKDIAGWYVCLEVIKALMDGVPYDGRKKKWEKVYERYVEVFKTM